METISTSDFIFKVIAVGNASVGKTSLTLRYATNKFEEDYRMTLGLNLTNKNIEIEHEGEELVVQLSIWDTGGQISFAPLIPMYYKGALGALVVFDLTNRVTFDAVDKWVHDVGVHCGQIPLVLLGNKSDLNDEIMVTSEDAKLKVAEISKSWEKDVIYFETSAKEDIRVNEAFTTLAQAILRIVDEEDEVEEPKFENLQHDV